VVDATVVVIAVIGAAVVVRGAAVVVTAVVVVAGGAAGVVAGAAVVALGVSQVATPPWWEHVPERVCEKLYVPSLQSAVAPAGGPSLLAADAANPPAPSAIVAKRSAAPRLNMPLLG
jgi:hypothetical protein